MEIYWVGLYRSNLNDTNVLVICSLVFVVAGISKLSVHRALDST